MTGDGSAREGPLDEFLDAMRAAGALDGDGVFTIDPDMAREKLDRFQLLHPEMWMCHLVVAAVAGGARAFSVKGRAGAWDIQYDGPPVGRPVLESLVPELWTGDAGFRALATGVRAVASLRPQRVTVECAGDGQRVRLRLQDGEQHVEEEESTASGTRILVEEGSVSAALRRLLPGGAEAEEGVLRSRCALAPLELVFNGQRVSEELSCEGCTSWRFVRDDSERARLPFKGEPAAESEGFSALLALCLPGDTPVFECGVVVDGLRFNVDDDPVGIPHVRWLAAAPLLALDMSLERPREDERWSGLIARLRDEAWKLVLSVCGDEERMRAMTREAMLGLMETVLVVERLLHDHREDPRLKTLVGARALICALHRDTLLGSGVDTVRDLTTLPTFGADPADRATVDAACDALAWALLDDSAEAARLEEVTALWRRVSPSDRCALFHGRGALEAGGRGRLEEARTLIRQAREAGSRWWLQHVHGLIERACGAPEAGHELHETAPGDGLRTLFAGDAALLVGDLELAAERCAASVEGLRKMQGRPRAMWIATALESLAEVERLAGRYAEALSHWEQALRLRTGDARFGPLPPGLEDVPFATKSRIDVLGAMWMWRQLKRLAGRSGVRRGGWRVVSALHDLRLATRYQTVDREAKDGELETAEAFFTDGSPDLAVRAYQMLMRGMADDHAHVRYTVAAQRCAFILRTRGRWREADAYTAIMHLRRAALEGSLYPLTGGEP